MTFQMMISSTHVGREVKTRKKLGQALRSKLCCGDVLLGISTVSLEVVFFSVNGNLFPWRDGADDEEDGYYAFIG